MSKPKALRRRKRRREKAKLTGKNAVRPHRKIGGQTGSVQAKRTPGRTPYIVHALVEVAPVSAIAVRLGAPT